MTRNYKQARSDFSNRTVAKLSRHYFLFSSFFFFRIIIANWTETAENFSSLFCSFSFFIPYLPTISSGIVVKCDKKLLTSSVLYPRLNSGKLPHHFFLFFSFLLSYFLFLWIQYFERSFASHFLSVKNVRTHQRPMEED